MVRKKPNKSRNGACDRLRSPRNDGKESGFTLLETLLVLCILAALAAMAIPALDRPFANQRLVKAADQVRSQLARARVDAIESGCIRTFRSQTGDDGVNNRYHVESVNFDGSTISSDTNDGSQQVIIPPADGTLPDGVSFASLTIDDTSTDATGTTDNGQTGSLDASMILFYPDGTSSTAVVTVANNLGRSVDVTLRGMTGTAVVGTVQTGGSGP